MTVYAIGDLHLPGGDEKPMEVFGSHWQGHWEKICQDWREKVQPGDVVLIPGDISWAMQLEAALPDLKSIGALPGRKVILRGNHDYWWSSLTRVREALPEGMFALQNDALQLDGITFCGSRGWMYPQSADDTENERLYERELIRLRISLERAREISPVGPLIALTHYPPVPENGAATRVSALMSQFRVNDVVYGHLHGVSVKTAFDGMVEGVRYHYVACDGLGFRLRRIAPLVADNPNK